MKRRSFIANAIALAAVLHLDRFLGIAEKRNPQHSLYSIFQNPARSHYPFVRWWWNGDKIERDEISRELQLLKNVGIAGVEINPIKFPLRTDDLGKKSVEWLSDEWLDLFQFASATARSLGMTCDLLVGSGWPFGAEWLRGEERSQIVVIATKIVNGAGSHEIPLDELLKDAMPSITSPFAGREMEILSINLLPAAVNRIDDLEDLSGQVSNGAIRFSASEGKHVLYAVVKINGFMQVIQGAPGASGPVLNHYNANAVNKYLLRMSARMKEKLGPLSTDIHSLFIDSLELEGANWCEDMSQEFERRRGYSLMPWLPLILHKITAMGNDAVYDYGVEDTDDLREQVGRVRYDFELTKSELLEERFIQPVVSWCRQNNVSSRVQAYGRGYHPLDGSFHADIPECETWLRPGLGLEMNDSTYSIGRAYTVVNKYVSSAAHLQGKNLVSCEEMTNIHMVFNETLELMKIASDQSIISGVTHSILHGFNYSPPEALLPGWVIYGSFINERNPWWPYLHNLIQYKARLSALLQNATMFADIAILPAVADLWTQYGAQNDPFPAVMHPPWQTLVWESIHQNGNGCDYVSEKIIQQAVIDNGLLRYGPRTYHTIFLTQVRSIEPATAKKLLDFVLSGGRIFCLAGYPEKACGWTNHVERDRQVEEYVAQLRQHEDRFVVLKNPENSFITWFRDLQKHYGIEPYLTITSPNSFVSQVRYRAGETEIFVLVNSNLNHDYLLTITPSPGITRGRYPWMWDPETGEKFRLQMNDNSIQLHLGPADLRLVIFDRTSKGPYYKQAPPGLDGIELKNSWKLIGNHIDGSSIQRERATLGDLKDMPEWQHFGGNLVYTTRFTMTDKSVRWLNLGKVFGVSEILINGRQAGTKWYGTRIFDIGRFVMHGENELEVRLTTTMGNYLKSLTENPVAQFWTNQGRTIQSLQSIGMAGPVTIY